MKTMVALPCMDMVHTAFLNSLLKLQLDPTSVVSITQGTLIYDARNRLFERAMNENCDRILFLDSDMVFDPDLLIRLNADMEEREFVSGIYFKRKVPIAPVIYSSLDYEIKEDGLTYPKAEIMVDYPRDQIFEVAGAGFGGVLIKTDLIRRVYERFGPPFSPMIGFGEDLSFCKRATAIGAKLWCDSRIKLGHVMQTIVDEQVYAAGLV